MSSSGQPSGFPDEPYKYLGQTARDSSRPVLQGDVFRNIPLVGAAEPHPRQAGTWVPRARTGERAIGMVITHPCASRSRTTHRLNPVLSVAPVVRCPSNWGPPWDGHYSCCPLPQLIDGVDYVAKLDEVCPVQADALAGRRIASLSHAGLAGLFHRLAMNSLRFPDTPVHYETEAARLTAETDLWETWVMRTGTEEGFQEWLDEEFSGDFAQESGDGPSRLEGPRRARLLWNTEEIDAELAAYLAGTESGTNLSETEGN